MGNGMNTWTREEINEIMKSVLTVKLESRPSNRIAREDIENLDKAAAILAWAYGHADMITKPTTKNN